MTSDTSSNLSRRTLLGGTAATAVSSSASADSVQLAQQPAARPSENRQGGEPVNVERAFVRIREGLVHYRHAGEQTNDGPLPLYMMHAGPGSSKGLASMVSVIGQSRRCIAADTLGFGDSAPPEPEEPDLVYYADSVVRIWDALGLDKVDVYGSHTGANVGLEIAIARPDRVRKLVFDGVAIYDPEMAAENLANYAPKVKPQPNGEHFLWAWNFIKNMGLYYPYYKTDPEHYLGKAPRPPEGIHNSVLDVMKALDHYHKGYNAVFRHQTRDRLPLCTVPTYCMAHEADPLKRTVEEAAALVPNSEHRVLPTAFTREDRAREVVRFLDA